MAQQKLYTEEQIREAFDNGYRYASTLRPTALEEHYKYVENSIKSLTPIELPSDEEEEQNAISLTQNLQQHIGFNMGVTWMKEQILNQNK